MLVISAGMQKSGSAYIYNLINDLLVSAGFKNARDIKEKYDLNEIMKWHNNNVGDLNRKLLLKLLYLSINEGTFAVKTHSMPTRFHNILLRLGLIKTIYIYRDPRDVLLSAQDHGRRIREGGESHTFANFIEFEDAIKAVEGWTNIFKSYNGIKGVLSICYEELWTNPNRILGEICEYLNINVSIEDMNKILLKYDKNNKETDMKGLHFNKAIINRYRDELSEIQKEIFKKNMGEVIQKMGYEI